MTDDLTPARNLDAEQALLGALLLDPAHALDLATEIDGADFSEPRHETIWDAAQALAQTHELDPIALKDRLDRTGEMKLIQGGATYLTDLMAACPVPGNAVHYARLVRDAARIRVVAEVAARLKHVAATANPDGVDEAMAHAVDALDTAAGRFTGSKPSPTSGAALTFASLLDLRKRVADQGPRRWLIRGLWPAGTYGVHAAEQKAQKTWNAFDLAVSVASGTPWLGHFTVDDPGPVVIFAGEGGESGVVRRLVAIAQHRDLDPDQLPIVVCAKAPHLSDTGHMRLFREAMSSYHPKLVILDPLYLAAKGADLKDLYAMGALLEVAQHACADVDAALWVNHHHNRSRDARGSGRMSGAGPAEWGRVLLSAKVISRHTEPDTKETRVLTELEAIGGDIPDDKFRIFRKIRADDPDDLDSALHYATEVLASDDTATTDAAGDPIPTDPSTPAQKKLLEAMQAKAQPASTKDLVDWIADKYGHGLTRETVSKALNDLANRGAADCVEQDQAGGRWPLKLWFIPTPTETP